MAVECDWVIYPKRNKGHSLLSGEKGARVLEVRKDCKIWVLWHLEPPSLFFSRLFFSCNYAFYQASLSIQELVYQHASMFSPFNLSLVHFANLINYLTKIYGFAIETGWIKEIWSSFKLATKVYHGRYIDPTEEGNGSFT